MKIIKTAFIFQIRCLHASLFWLINTSVRGFIWVFGTQNTVCPSLGHTEIWCAYKHNGNHLEYQLNIHFTFTVWLFICLHVAIFVSSTEIWVCPCVHQPVTQVLCWPHSYCTGWLASGKSFLSSSMVGLRTRNDLHCPHCPYCYCMTYCSVNYINHHLRVFVWYILFLGMMSVLYSALVMLLPEMRGLNLLETLDDLEKMKR